MYQSSSKTVLVEQAGAVLRIRFNRPERLNALNYEAITAAIKLIRQAGQDWGVRAVVFEGAGAAFCSSDDVEDMGEWPKEYAHRQPGGSHGPGPILEQDLLRLIRPLQKPTMAMEPMMYSRHMTTNTLNRKLLTTPRSIARTGPDFKKPDMPSLLLDEVASNLFSLPLVWQLCREKESLYSLLYNSVDEDSN